MIPNYGLGLNSPTPVKQPPVILRVWESCRGRGPQEKSLKRKFLLNGRRGEGVGRGEGERCPPQGGVRG